MSSLYLSPYMGVYEAFAFPVGSGGDRYFFADSVVKTYVGFTEIIPQVLHLDALV
ncbi:hypothetical protein [Nostoc sp. ChiQUE01b]|uniref:hypothetical protein n=1 Tax=Nostoc sp. ChiQUE01b TaxID=3075376 RepID=UPI002AD4B975|nr:hypothetical protein [Nostoc sp. ChiQUE01b]MDZ8263420.1 hypothetical protein [Nostoc sp. ChiQUE01b]